MITIKISTTMKKLLSIFAICCLLAMSCNNNKQTINSKDLQGRYEIDFSAALNQLTDDADNDFAKAFAALLLSKLELTLQFDGDRLIIDGSDAVSGLINAFSEEGEGMPYALDYKILNDSVLCTRENANMEFNEVGVLRKMGESFDYLQFVTANDDGEEIVLTMRKIY